MMRCGYAYLLLWAGAHAIRILTGVIAATALGDATAAQPVLLLLAQLGLVLVFPDSPLLLGGAMLLRAGTNLAKGTALPNSQLWATQTDLAFAIALLCIVTPVLRPAPARTKAGAAPPSEARIPGRRSVEVRRWLLWRLSAAEQEQLVGLAGPVIRAQLVIFYSASAFWKLNSSFTSADHSCAGIFATLLFEYLPDDRALDGPLQLVAQLAPRAVLTVEWLIPTLLAAPPGLYRRLGGLLMLLFHLSIALTPPPLNIASFGVTTCTRLYFFFPEATEAAFRELTGGGWLLATSVATFASLTAITWPMHASAISTVQGSGVDLHLVYLGLILVPLLYAIWLDAHASPSMHLARPTSPASQAALNAAPSVAAQTAPNAAPSVAEQTAPNAAPSPASQAAPNAVPSTAAQAAPNAAPSPASQAAPDAAPQTCSHTKEMPSIAASRYRVASRTLLAMAGVYAFGLPIAGLQERGNCAMFAQLRQHGGSNHWLVPTAVLQRLLVHADPSNAFAGGVVRIEATNLSWMPNAFAEHIGPRGKRLMARARQHAELIMLVKATTSTLSTPSGPKPRSYKHTLSALGLRRLVAQAKALPAPFWLEYTRLHGAEGDHRWRGSSPGLRVRLQGGGDGLPIQCELITSVSNASSTALGSHEACDATERALIAPESAKYAWATFFLAPYANPIADDDGEQTHCVGF